MPQRHSSTLASLALLAALAAAPAAPAQPLVYLTNFPRTNNIYTSLDQEFPSTGPGVPGSGVGVPNSTFLFDPATYTSPNAIAGSNLANNGVTFQLASDATGRDFLELTSISNTVTIPVSRQVRSAYTLTGAYFGRSFNVTFTGADGATETFSNLFVPDFFNGGFINDVSAVNGSPANNQFDQTVFEVNNQGGGGIGNSSTGGIG